MRIVGVSLHILSPTEMTPASVAALAMLLFCLTRQSLTPWSAAPSQLPSYTFFAFSAVYLDRAGFHVAKMDNFLNMKRLGTYLGLVYSAAVITFVAGAIIFN